MVHTFEDLRHHVGHEIACVTYGDPAANVAIECETCSEVLLDFDAPADDSARYEILDQKGELVETWDTIDDLQKVGLRAAGWSWRSIIG